MSKEELMVKVYSFNGSVIVSQENGPSEDEDVIRLEPRQIKPLIDALLKALAQVEVTA